MTAKLILKNIHKDYKSEPVLKDISFQIAKGEFVSIIGPSGCGKTTLLYLIQGFLQKNKGVIDVYGRTGFVFQDHNLFPWKTVKQNIEVGPLNQGKQDDNLTQNLLKEVQLHQFADHYPHQISEGMKQRVGIARCLANNPEILLMDEPFGSLDYLTRLKVQDFLIKLCKQKELTVLFVTHDIDEAIKLSDRIIVLSDRPTQVKTILKADDISKEKILKLVCC